MTSRFLALVATFLLVTLVGCQAPRTQVVVVIDADSTIRAQATSVRLEIWRFDGTRGDVLLQESVMPRVMPGRDSVPWPFQTVLTPLNNDPTRRYEVSATAIDSMGRTLVVSRAISGYTPGDTRVLRLFLSTQCRLDVAPVCAATETCNGGRCVPIFRQPESLPTLTTYNTDAGAPDSNSADAWSATDVYVPPGTDADIDAPDAFVESPDAYVLATDAGMDAFVEPGTDAGMDAFVAPPDAFTPTDANSDAGPLIITGPAMLPPPVGASASWGSSVAISDDGQHIAVAGSQGVRAWHRDGFGWTLDFDRSFPAIDPEDASNNSAAVAFNANGTVLAIGHAGDATEPDGRAWYFEPLGFGWTPGVRQLGPLTFGISVAVNGDGTHVYVGEAGGFTDIRGGRGSVRQPGRGCSMAASHTLDVVAIGPCSLETGIAVYAWPSGFLSDVTAIPVSYTSLAFGGSNLAVGDGASLGGAAAWVGAYPYNGLGRRVISSGFGASVGLSANGHLVVGVAGDESFYLDATRTIRPPGASGFGVSVAVDSAANVIVVGASNVGGTGPMAYVYETFRSAS